MRVNKTMKNSKPGKLVDPKGADHPEVLTGESAMALRYLGAKKELKELREQFAKYQSSMTGRVAALEKDLADAAQAIVDLRGQADAAEIAAVAAEHGVRWESGVSYQSRPDGSFVMKRLEPTGPVVDFGVGDGDA